MWEEIEPTVAERAKRDSAAFGAPCRRATVSISVRYATNDGGQNR